MGSGTSDSWPTVLCVRTYEGGYTPHCHDHSQVLLGLSGSLQLEVEGHAAFVDASCGLVVPAGSRHDYAAPAAAEVLVLDCDVARGTDRLRRFALPPQWTRRLDALNAQQILHDVAGAPALQSRRRLDLAPLLARVDAELHRQWTLDELAALCRFSAPRFRVRFAELTGLPPLTWLRQRRLDEAQRQLRAGLPLETVALHVGYASASALCFALRRERGVGARELRADRGVIRASLDI
jgi:AraC-like DNA-binding protein/mannose-6-phosphate isomerase-like protein (cupin superfamily)